MTRVIKMEEARAFFEKAREYETQQSELLNAMEIEGVRLRDFEAGYVVLSRIQDKRARDFARYLHTERGVGSFNGESQFYLTQLSQLEAEAINAIANTGKNSELIKELMSSRDKRMYTRTYPPFEVVVEDHNSSKELKVDEIVVNYRVARFNPQLSSNPVEEYIACRGPLKVQVMYNNHRGFEKVVLFD